MRMGVDDGVEIMGFGVGVGVGVGGTRSGEEGGVEQGSSGTFLGGRGVEWSGGRDGAGFSFFLCPSVFPFVEGRME